MSHAYSVKHSGEICKTLNTLQFEKVLSDVYLEHLKVIVHSVFMLGYKGKIVHTALFSEHHRTSVSHFLNNGKWNSRLLDKLQRKRVVERVYRESRKSGRPVLCIVDDTIASHTKPSSQAKHPIEAAYYHQSHLKKRPDYGHQAVGVMLSCNGLSLNYAIVLYDKSCSKMEIVQDIVQELPTPPGKGYFLCDSWYTSSNLMKALAKKGFYTIGALKTNRVIYPSQGRQKISQFAQYIRKDAQEISFVTVGNRAYTVYRYQGKLNNCEDAVVLISFPEQAFGEAQALRAFISTQTELTTQDIFELYAARWNIEVFFRSCKQKLAFDKCQLRKKQGIERFWLILSIVHYMCCTISESSYSFEAGYAYYRNCVLKAAFAESAFA